MRTMTATEASRAFAALLDGAERGETVIITRGGRRIAEIGPAAAGNGRAFADLIVPGIVDVEFGDDVRAARSAVELGGPAWPAV
ncbi:hypothetical protein [Agromyces neolithicus]|uniref:Antitoxin n=1 Tax=Agromyces neolithicus TaxID=269420 RepID=A0ABP4XZ05_9MICO